MELDPKHNQWTPLNPNICSQLVGETIEQKTMNACVDTGKDCSLIPLESL